MFSQRLFGVVEKINKKFPEHRGDAEEYIHSFINSLIHFSHIYSFILSFIHPFFHVFIPVFLNSLIYSSISTLSWGSLPSSLHEKFP